MGIKKFFYKLMGKDRNFVREGEELYNNCEYIKAMNKFEEALLINPKNKHAKKYCENIKKILLLHGKANKLFKECDYNGCISTCEDILSLNRYDNKIKNIMSSAKKISKLIEEGDKLYKSHKYLEAIDKYNEILSLNPNDNKYNVIINEIKLLLEKIENLEKEGDMYCESKKYPDAIERYTKLLELCHNNEEMKNKIENKLKNINKMLEKVDFLKERGDKLYATGDYESALDMYQEASYIYPHDSEVANKILEIKNLLYTTFKNNANSAFNSFNYKSALSYYLRITELHIELDDDEYKKIHENIALLEKILKLNEEGDELYASGDYQNAIVYYSEILKHIPNDKNIISKIDKCKSCIDKIKNLMVKGHQALSNEEYEKALKIFNEILGISPTNEEAKSNVDKISNYLDAINKGDAYFKNNDYEKALLFYKDAYLIFKREELNSKIQKVKKLLYEHYKNHGERELQNKNYRTSLEYYKKAYELYHYKDIAHKIKKLTKIVNNLKIAESEYNKGNYKNSLKHYEELNKLLNDEGFNDKIEHIKSLLKYIQKGDELYNGGNYIESMPYYKRALKLNPQDKYVKEKIDKVEKIRSLVSKGDEEFNKGNYDVALKYYTDYLMYVDDNNVKDKIEYIHLKTEENYYKILNVKEDASKGEIKKAFIKLSRKYIPEKYPEIYAKIRKAYDTLSNEKERKEYTILMKYGDTINKNLEDADNYLSNGNYSSAISCLKKILAIHPGYKEALKLIIIAYKLSNDEYNCKEYCVKLLNKHGDDYDELVFCGDIYTELGQNNSRYYIDAENCYLKAIDIKDMPYEAYVGLIKLYRQKSEYDIAFNYVNKIIELKKGIKNITKDIIMEILLVGLFSSKYEKTKQYIKEWADYQPDDIKEITANEFADISSELVKNKAHKPAALCLELAYYMNNNPEFKNLYNLLYSVSDAYEEVPLLMNDSSIIDPLKSIMVILVGAQCGEEIPNGEMLFNSAVSNLDHYAVYQIRDSIYTIERKYPNVAKLCSEFLNKLKYAL